MPASILRFVIALQIYPGLEVGVGLWQLNMSSCIKVEYTLQLMVLVYSQRLSSSAVCKSKIRAQNRKNGHCVCIFCQFLRMSDNKIPIDHIRLWLESRRSDEVSWNFDVWNWWNIIVIFISLSLVLAISHCY